MRLLARFGFFGWSASLWFVAAAGFFGVKFFPPFVVLALPFMFPGLFVLGVDEVQERYGYWGEPFYDWLLSLPCVFLYAWLIRRHFLTRTRPVGTKLLKPIAIAVTSLAAVALVAANFTFVVVTNRSGVALSGVQVLSESFQFQIGALQPEESRWYLRRATGSCGVTVNATHAGTMTREAAGFITSDDHGYAICVSIRQDFRPRVSSFPPAITNTSKQLTTE